MYPGHWSAVQPDKAAAIHSGSGETLTYKQLDDRSNQLAQLMWSLGMRRGDHLAIFMENDLRYFEVLWAALRSGLYLTTVNRYLTEEEAAYIINDSESQLLVTSSYLAETAARLPELCPNVRCLLAKGDAIAGYENYDEVLNRQPAKPLAEQPSGSLMLYSSGTTGRPKGVLRPLPETAISEENTMMGALQKLLWEFDENTVYLSPAPMYHSAPINFSNAVQTLGGTVVIMPRFDEEQALQTIEKYKITHSQWVPTMFSRMLKLDPELRNRYDLSSQRVAIHAAAPCPREVKKQMLDWWGPIIYEYYAGTEANGFTHVTPKDWLRKPGTVGQSILGTIHICDEDGKELPVGETGLVYFELPETPFRYLKDEAKTKEAQHPEHSNWTALGDVGYIDDEGFLFLTDRATHMIISGGVNIYPQEIEDILVLHPEVADAAVIGVPNQEMGEEVKAVVQLVKGASASDELAESLIDYVREQLAHYKAPRSVDFTDELPRLPTGKLYKRLLKDQYWGKSGSRIV